MSHVFILSRNIFIVLCLIQLVAGCESTSWKKQADALSRYGYVQGTLHVTAAPSRYGYQFTMVDNKPAAATASLLPALHHAGYDWTDPEYTNYLRTIKNSNYWNSDVAVIRDFLNGTLEDFYNLQGGVFAVQVNFGSLAYRESNNSNSEVKRVFYHKSRKEYFNIDAMPTKAQLESYLGEGVDYEYRGAGYFVDFNDLDYNLSGGETKERTYPGMRLRVTVAGQTNGFSYTFETKFAHLWVGGYAIGGYKGLALAPFKRTVATLGELTNALPYDEKGYSFDARLIGAYRAFYEKGYDEYMSAPFANVDIPLSSDWLAPLKMGTVFRNVDGRVERVDKRDSWRNSNKLSMAEIAQAGWATQEARKRLFDEESDKISLILQGTNANKWMNPYLSRYDFYELRDSSFKATSKSKQFYTRYTSKAFFSEFYEDAFIAREVFPANSSILEWLADESVALNRQLNGFTNKCYEYSSVVKLNRLKNHVRKLKGIARGIAKGRALVDAAMTMNTMPEELAGYLIDQVAELKFGLDYASKTCNEYLDESISAYERNQEYERNSGWSAFFAGLGQTIQNEYIKSQLSSGYNQNYNRYNNTNERIDAAFKDPSAYFSGASDNIASAFLLGKSKLSLKNVPSVKVPESVQTNYENNQIKGTGNLVHGESFYNAPFFFNEEAKSDWCNSSMSELGFTNAQLFNRAKKENCDSNSINSRGSAARDM